jgi:PAS domain S-box-containing protein
MSSSHPRKLLILGLVVSNLLVLLISAYSLYQSRAQHEQDARVLSRSVTDVLDQNVSGSIEKIDLALRTIADELERQLAGKGIDAVAMSDFMRRQAGRIPEIVTFRAANADGQIFLNKGGDPQRRIDWSGRDYFIHHRDQSDGRMHVSRPFVGSVSEEYVIGLTRRYNHPDGRFAGVIIAPVRIAHLEQVLSRFDLGSKGTAILRDHELRLIARHPPIPEHPAGKIGNIIAAQEIRALVESGARTATFHAPGALDGIERTGTFRRMDVAPLIISVGIASVDYLRPWKAEAYKTAAAAVGFLSLSLLLGGFLLRQMAWAERHELELEQSEARLKKLFASSPDPTWIIEGNRFVDCNEAAVSLLGYSSREALLNTHPSKLSPPTQPDGEDSFAKAERMMNLAQEKGLHRFEWVHTRADGSEFWAEVTLSAFELQGGPALYCNWHDIGARKRSEAELEEYRQHLERMVAQRTAELQQTEAKASHILASSADGLYGIDREGLITFINAAACTLLGYRANAVIGKHAHTLFHHSHSDGSAYPAQECPSSESLRHGQTVRVDNEVYWHADGHAVPVMYSTHPMLRDGAIVGAVTSFVDMTAQRAAAQAREQALAAAEHLAATRRDFINNMNHEIRTPLHGVLAFAKIGLRNVQNSEKVQAAFTQIQDSGNRLHDVLNDILNFSDLDSGKLTIERREMVIADLVESAMAPFRDRARAKQLALHTELAPGLPRSCIGDPVRVAQVLDKLLANAIKFTETGSITVAVRRQDKQLLFSVADTGIGMDASRLNRLFRPFEQADATSTRQFGGTGLGLAIAKRIVELMGGAIRAESEPGQGSRFEFRIPCLPPDASA